MVCNSLDKELWLPPPVESLAMKLLLIIAILLFQKSKGNPELSRGSLKPTMGESISKNEGNFIIHDRRR